VPRATTPAAELRDWLDEAGVAVLWPPVVGASVGPTGAFGIERPRGTHLGLDLVAAEGTPVRAIHAGHVLVMEPGTDSESRKRAGRFVSVTLQVERAGGSALLVVSQYLHLASSTVATGDLIGPGQVVGTVGRTGVEVSGAHLHVQCAYTPPGNSGLRREALWFFNPQVFAAVVAARTEAVNG
jgi:murein DD-endopeptidase MepM/ murein hydrolase activator NlpD